MMHWMMQVLRGLGVAVVLTLSACHGDLPWHHAPAEPVPTKSTPKVTLDIDLTTLEVSVVEPEGARVCSLCTDKLREKYGPACEKAPEAGIPICAGLVNATVQNFSTLTLMRSHWNPYCVTVGTQIIGGTPVTTQLCICQPTDPPSVCQGRAWWYQ